MQSKRRVKKFMPSAEYRPFENFGTGSNQPVVWIYQPTTPPPQEKKKKYLQWGRWGTGVLKYFKIEENIK